MNLTVPACGPRKTSPQLLLLLPRTSSTRPSTNSSAEHPLGTLAPLTHPAMMSLMEAYRDPSGRSKSLVSLAWNRVVTTPTMRVTTLTPKGESSRRSVSERLVRAALDEAYAAFICIPLK